MQLAAGLFIGPFVGHEPKGQRFLVLSLFGAIAVVVVGAMSGAWLSISGFFEENSFYLGHQGYEYIELGRVWQILLIVGMLIWLVLVLRSISPALKQEEDSGGLTHMLLYSSISIPLFYMAGLMYGKGSHLSNAEYWRWWVVHLWVEGFFEVFATVVMAFLLSYQGINTTPIHSHTALFGVYGLLAISLLLFSVRHIVTRESWSDNLLNRNISRPTSGLTIFRYCPRQTGCGTARKN